MLTKQYLRLITIVIGEWFLVLNALIAEVALVALGYYLVINEQLAFGLMFMLSSLIFPLALIQTVPFTLEKNHIKRDISRIKRRRARKCVPCVPRACHLRAS
jgi:hypothetical protein